MINDESDLLKKIDKTLKDIREKNALTHCITNSVTINDCANAVLAIGGSPFMAEDAEELEEVAKIRLLHNFLFVWIYLLRFSSPLKRIKRTSLAEIV
jgi:hypothetical protein